MLLPLAVVLLHLCAGQEVPPPRSFYYDFSTSPPPPTFFAPINGADFENGQLVLNDDKPSINSAAYTTRQLWVNSFRANFTFLLGNSPNGHHGGFAFVVQADTLSKAGPNDAGIGYGSNPNTADPGLTHSLAIEFDTFVDPGVDDTPNCQAAPHFAAHTMGAGANSAVESAANWNATCFTQITNPYTQGNKVHNVTVVYLAPVLTVYYDEIVQPVLTVRLDLATQLALTNGLAYVGFTASTGSQGGDRHAITSMAFDYLSALSSGSSAAAGVQPNQTAGAVGTFTLQAFDEFGHPYPFGGAAVLVNFSAVTDPDQLTYVVTDLKTGNYSVSFNITLAASGDLEVTMDGVLVKGMPTALQIVAGAVDAQWGNFSGALTYAEAGQSAQVTFLVFDHYRNPTSAPCSFTGTTLSNNETSIDLGTPKETSPGQWSFTFVAKQTGHYYWNVVVNGVPFAEQPKPLWVSNGPASAANSTVSGLSNSFSAGTPQTCVLSVRDSEGNVFSENVTTSVSLRNATSTIAAVLQSFDESGDYTYTFTLFGAGTWIPSVLVVDKAVTSNVPAQLTVLSQAPLAASSDIVYGGAPIQTQAGDLIITVLEARDMYGNLISSDMGVTWNVLINSVAFPAVPSTAATGIWSVSWSPTVAATYTVAATMNGAAVVNSGQYQAVVSAQSTPVLHNTLFAGAGATNAHVGESTSFSFQLRDTYNNVIQVQLTVAVGISQGSTQAKVVVTFVPATATYGVVYTCPSSGVYLMNVTAVGQMGDPYVINVEGALTPGAIVGIVFGSIAFVALVIGVILLIRRKKRIYQPL